MKILFVGGTGLISSACSKLALERGHELTLLNRGRSTTYPFPDGAEHIEADARNSGQVLQALGSRKFDSVVDWIAFTPEDVQRDLALFGGRTNQYVFISSASAYQKPPSHYLITESTPLANPYWEYSRNKIACEERLLRAYREDGFPATIVRPSHTYGPSHMPLGVTSWKHPYTVVDRILQGQEVIVPGDGTSLWTLTWNEDFAVAFLGLLGRQSTVGHAFHITSDEALTWNQIYFELGAALGVRPRLVPISSEFIAAFDPDSRGGLIGDKSNCAVFDNSKVKRFVPEFVAKVSWAEGVRRVLAWHAEDESRRSLDAEANGLWDRILRAHRDAMLT